MATQSTKLKLPVPVGTDYFNRQAYVDLINAIDAAAVPLSEKAVANGFASLDSSGDVPLAQLDNLYNVLKGLGFSDSIKDLGTVDANNVLSHGLYYVSSTSTNIPVSSVGFFIINLKLGSNIIQSAYGNNTNRDMFIRRYAGGAWGAWQQSETTTGAQGKVNSHAADMVAHITAAERNTWNAKAPTTPVTTSVNGLMIAADKSKLDGVAAGAEVNQNAVSGLKVGSTTVASASKSQVVELVADTNVVLTPDNVAKKVTVGLSANVETTTGAFNKSETAKNAAIDFAKSFGLGSTVKKLTTGDLNTITESGFYFADDAVSNKPTSGDDYYIINSIYASGSGVQIAVLSGSSNRMFVRRGSVNTWNAWSEIETVAGSEAKVNATQKAKVTQDSGYEIALASTDLNTVLMTGFYYTTGSTNMPTGVSNNGHLQVFARSSTYAVQHYTPYSSSQVYIRVYNNGTWTAWSELQTDSAVDVKIANSYKRVRGSDSTTKTDIKTLAPGRYFGSYFTNSPLAPTDGSYSNVDVTDSLDGTMKQIVFTVNGDNKTYTAMVSTSGALSAWSELETVAGSTSKANTAESNAKAASAPIAHVGAGGTAHAAATTSVAGFMSSADKTKLNGIATGAEVNQNSFTSIKVGTQTVAADSKTDTLELVGGNRISLVPDVTNDKVTFNLDLEVQTELWSGSSYLQAATTIAPTKPLSQCRNGWIFVWSDYDVGNHTNDFNWAFSFIPKAFPSMDNGGSAYIQIPNYATATEVKYVIKTIYINDGTITGHDDNMSDAVEGRDVVLRKVLEF